MLDEIRLKEAARMLDMTAFIVDGQYIRNNLDPDFTNFGQHYRFNFIPENEFWIDKEHGGDSELPFFLAHLLVEHRLMAHGTDYKRALEQANQIEKLERLKTDGIVLNKHIKPDVLADQAHIEIVNSNKDVVIWRVNGRIVRDLAYNDFTEGGHGYVYTFIPKNEIWIDNDVAPQEVPYIVVHEAWERLLMKDGKKSYKKAHAAANEIELFFRKKQVFK